MVATVQVDIAGTPTTMMTLDGTNERIQFHYPLYGLGTWIGDLVQGYDAAAFVTISTADAGKTTIAQTSDGDDGIIIGDGGDQVQILGVTAGANDGFYDGLVRTFTVDAGATSVFGQALHVDTDGELIVADGDVASAGSMPAIGLAVEAGTGSKKVLLQGLICETDWDWTIGGIVYVSDDATTTEGLTQTAISTAGDTVQVVGVATTGDCIEVNMGGYRLVEVPTP